MKHKLRVSGKVFANLIHVLPLSLSSFHFLPAWNMDVSLEVQQPYCDYEVTSLRMKTAMLRMVGQRDGCD